MEIINLKLLDYPTVDYSIAVVETEIERLSICDGGIIKVIHGYGSHGKGGTIRIELRKYLEKQKRLKKIKDYINGESLTSMKLLNYNLPQNIIDSLMSDEDNDHFNPGHTIIIVFPDKKHQLFPSKK
jgi:hypothetical protein